MTDGRHLFAAQKKRSKMEYVPPARKMEIMSDEAIVSTLKHTASQLIEQSNKAMGRNILDYVNKREEYKANHRGKYVLISDNGVDMVGESPINTGFSENQGGLLLKIGDEIKYTTSAAMYLRHYTQPTRSYTMPMSFGDRSVAWTQTFEAVVDTGCDTTTIDADALKWIRVTLGAHYVTDFEQIDVVNGKTAVESGLMDFDVAGKPFRSHKVLFADLNGRGALIGSDVLNSGKLDMECGRSISFTHH